MLRGSDDVSGAHGNLANWDDDAHKLTARLWRSQGQNAEASHLVRLILSDPYAEKKDRDPGFEESART